MPERRVWVTVQDNDGWEIVGIFETMSDAYRSMHAANDPQNPHVHVAHIPFGPVAYEHLGINAPRGTP